MACKGGKKGKMMSISERKSEMTDDIIAEVIKMMTASNEPAGKHTQKDTGNKIAERFQTGTSPS